MSLVILGKIIIKMKKLKLIRDSYLQYDKKEREVFISHMPNWYKLYETHWVFILLRGLGFIWFLISRYILPVFLSLYCELNSNIYVYRDIADLSVLVVFFFFLTLRFILRFIYIKELLYKNPYNRRHTTFVIILQLSYPLILFVLILLIGLLVINLVFFK